MGPSGGQDHPGGRARPVHLVPEAAPLTQPKKMALSVETERADWTGACSSIRGGAEALPVPWARGPRRSGADGWRRRGVRPRTTLLTGLSGHPVACGPGSYAAAATAVAAGASARCGRPCLPKARAVPSRCDAECRVGGSAWWLPGAAVLSHAQPRRGSACSAARLLMGGQPLKLPRQGCHPLAAPHGAVRPHLFSRSLLALPVGPLGATRVVAGCSRSLPQPGFRPDL